MGNREFKSQEIQKEWTAFKIPSEHRPNPRKPACTPETCPTLADYYQFRDYASREWSVYLAEIKLARERFQDCVERQKTNHGERCAKEGFYYYNLTRDENLMDARRFLYKTGVPLVTDKYVYGTGSKLDYVGYLREKYNLPSYDEDSLKDLIERRKETLLQSVKEFKNAQK